jgi:hypothetical protein
VANGGRWSENLALPGMGVEEDAFSRFEEYCSFRSRLSSIALFQFTVEVAILGGPLGWGGRR